MMGFLIGVAFCVCLEIVYQTGRSNGLQEAAKTTKDEK